MHGVGPGSLLGGRYVVSRRVAQHSRYERWAAADQTLDREVILLCFSADGPVGSATLDAARRAAGVEDHRLVRVLDVGLDAQLADGVAFVVEEPLTGARSVSSALADGGLPADEARRVVGEAASALERARVRGLHHGVLTPRSVFWLPDGGVKVRGLATEAALLEADDAPPDQATRADTVALVALGYALITGRWPLAGPDSGLEAAPRVVGGVAAPSEIAAGVPADLDRLARTTLNENHGPQTPGELAEQIGPWSPAPVGALAVREAPRTSRARTEPIDLDRSTPALAHVPGGTAPARTPPARTPPARTPPARAGAAAAATSGPHARTGGSASGSLRSVLGMTVGGRPAVVGAGEGEASAAYPDEAGPSEGGAERTDRRIGERPDEAPQGGPAYGPYEEGDEGYDDGTTGVPRRAAPVAGAVAAGSAMARGIGQAVGAAGGLASTVGDRVGGLARGAADRAAERSATKAERRHTERLEDPVLLGEHVRLSDTLEPTEEELEPALPMFPGTAHERLDRDQSRVALVIVAAFVIVAAALGIWGLPKISGVSVSGSAPVVTATVTASPGGSAASAAPSPAPTPAPTSQAPAPQPLAIAAASQISQDAGVQPNPTAAAAYDGDPATMWRSSKWYATAQYGGYQNRQVGLLLDLGQPSDVHQVTFTTRGAADVTVLVANEPKTDGATPIGSVSQQDGDGTVSVPNGGAVNGRYVILWFTTLGPDGQGHFRAQIAEASVR